MADEASGPVAQMLASNSGGPWRRRFRTMIRQAGEAKGKTLHSAQGQSALLLETNVGRLVRDGRSGCTSSKDWIAARLGPASATPTLATIMETGFSQMLSAMGCPPGLFLGGSASAAREDYRRWYSATVEPLAIMLAAELSLKLETPISLSFSGRFSGDLAGRARAFQSMVGAGMELAKAAGLAGLMVAED